jgi:hypothetical protein
MILPSLLHFSVDSPHSPVITLLSPDRGLASGPGNAWKSPEDDKSSAKAVKPLGQAQWREKQDQTPPPRGGGSTAFALLLLLNLAIR